MHNSPCASSVTSNGPQTHTYLGQEVVFRVLVQGRDSSSRAKPGIDAAHTLLPKHAIVRRQDVSSKGGDLLKQLVLRKVQELGLLLFLLGRLLMYGCLNCTAPGGVCCLLLRAVACVPCEAFKASSWSTPYTTWPDSNACTCSPPQNDSRLCTSLLQNLCTHASISDWPIVAQRSRLTKPALRTLLTHSCNEVTKCHQARAPTLLQIV